MWKVSIWQRRPLPAYNWQISTWSVKWTPTKCGRFLLSKLSHLCRWSGKWNLLQIVQKSRAITWDMGRGSKPEINNKTKGCLNLYVLCRMDCRVFLKFLAFFFVNLVWILYMYHDKRRDIRFDLAWAQGKSQEISLRLWLYFTLYPNSSHNTNIINF